MLGPQQMTFALSERTAHRTVMFSLDNAHSLMSLSGPRPPRFPLHPHPLDISLKFRGALTRLGLGTRSGTSNLGAPGHMGPVTIEAWESWPCSLRWPE